MSSTDLVRSNLTSPMVLTFVLGLFARIVRSDLRFPAGLTSGLSIYLLFAIGLKGGVALQGAALGQVGPSILATLLLSVATTGIAFGAGKLFPKFSRTDTAAMAAHYGSVSAVTFVAAFTYANAQYGSTEAFMPALVALLEVPAILIGIALAKSSTRSSGVLREVLTGKSIVLLVGGIVIGFVAGAEGIKPIAPMFKDLFLGALTLFLLDLGLMAGEQLQEIGRKALDLVIYGTCVPLTNGLLGVLAGHFAGMTTGGAMVLGTMAASASYIAAPASVRAAIPEARTGVYLAAALGITFPFNLILGIPIYDAFARWLG